MGSDAEEDSDGSTEGGKGRRAFFKTIVTLGILVALGSLASSFRILGFVPAPTQNAMTESLAWPRVKVANYSSLGTKLIRFNYPLVDTPNVLVKVGSKAENGVGPDSDVVAYSSVCQHLGCIYGVLQPGSSPPCRASYTASVVEGYCCCHGGQYLLAQGAAVVPGTPPPRPVPPVILEYEASTGDIYAVGMGPPTIFGHGPAGTSDPALVIKYDLEGGEIVTESTLFSGA